jgi:uncharacterized membrane protein
MMLACILAYPVLVHLSILLERPWLAGLALVALCASFIYPRLRAGRTWAWLGLATVIIASALAVQFEAQLYVLYLPPIVLPLAMLAWWAPSLRAGRTPMITRIATIIRGSLTPEYAAYTRNATVMWVGVFGLLATAGIGCALWTSAETWSLVTNSLNTIFIGLVFLGEYLYQRWRYPDVGHFGFITYIRRIIKAGVRPVA